MSTVEVRVCGRYKLSSKIGQGSYGNIYLARNVQTNQDVLIKSEEIKSKHPQLLFEGKIFQSLQGGIGIPSMHWCGQEGDFNFLVLEQTGQTLEDLLKLCGGKFSLKTVLMIADQLLQNFEYFHYKHYIHRDIRPENFVIGCGPKQSNIYTIDFGLAKRYRDSVTLEHIPFRDKKALISPVRFASVNAHKGYETSRRDDVESLLYMFVYFLNGQLPWQGVQASKKEEKYQKIRDIKVSLSAEELCAGLPHEFIVALKYIKNVQFEEKVEYSYLRKIFKERLVKEGFEYDDVFDWVLLPISQRLPTAAARIPLNVELLPNEEELLKQIAAAAEGDFIAEGEFGGGRSIHNNNNQPFFPSPNNNNYRGDDQNNHNQQMDQQQQRQQQQHLMMNDHNNNNSSSGQGQNNHQVMNSNNKQQQQQQQQQDYLQMNEDMKSSNSQKLKKQQQKEKQKKEDSDQKKNKSPSKQDKNKKKENCTIF